MVFRFTNDPLDNILALQNAIDRAYSRPFFGAGGTSGRGLYPALNFFEKDDTLIAKAELPGVVRDDLMVEIEGNRLTLAGKRVLPETGEERSYHRRERRRGHFRRAFRLPFEVDREKTMARYTDGVLTVVMEKAEAAKPRQITVKS